MLSVTAEGLYLDFDFGVWRSTRSKPSVKESQVMYVDFAFVILLFCDVFFIIQKVC